MRQSATQQQEQAQQARERLEQLFEGAAPRAGSLASLEIQAEDLAVNGHGRELPAQGHLRGADRAARVWYAKLSLLRGRAPFGPFLAAIAATSADVASCCVGFYYPDRKARAERRGQLRAEGRQLYMGLRRTRPELRPGEGVALLAWALLFAVLGQWGGGSFGNTPLEAREWAEPLDSPTE